MVIRIYVCWIVKEFVILIIVDVVVLLLVVFVEWYVFRNVEEFGFVVGVYVWNVCWF